MAVALPARPPLATPAATELYGRMEPYAHADPAIGWPLAWLCEAIGSQFEDVDDVAMQGWAYLADPDECPAWWLPHLAMWAGVKLDTGLPEADQRMQVREMVGLRRGTPAAMIAAAVPYLTGERRVRMTERNGGNAYEVLAQTYRSESPETDWTTGAANLCENPEAEGGTTDWSTSTLDGFTNVTLGEGGVPAPPPELEAPGVTTGFSCTGADNADRASTSFPVQVGETYSISLYVYLNLISTGHSVGFIVQDTGGNTIATQSTDVKGQWVRLGTDNALLAEAGPGNGFSVRVQQNEGGFAHWYFTAVLFERSDEVGSYFQGTRPPETTIVRDALMTQKPAGVRLIHQVIDGWTYGELEAAYEGKDYADLAGDFADYEELRTVIPD